MKPITIKIIGVIAMLLGLLPFLNAPGEGRMDVTASLVWEFAGLTTLLYGFFKARKQREEAKPSETPVKPPIKAAGKRSIKRG